MRRGLRVKNSTTLRRRWVAFHATALAADADAEKLANPLESKAPYFDVHIKVRAVGSGSH